MIDMDIFENNISHFKIAKRYGRNKVQAVCPAHDDRQASLTITIGKKCTLFYCHAGCKLNDILTAAGISKRDTFYDVESRKSSWKTYVESKENLKIEAVYNYFSLNGDYAFTKVRLQGKKMLYGILHNDRFSYGLNGRSRKDFKAIYGGLKAINRAVSEDKPIFYVEGEKDVDTLEKQGFVALTAGGVNDWQSDFAQLFKGSCVVVLADNDEPGLHLANTVYTDLQGVVKNVKIIVSMPDMLKGDISDFFEAGHSKEDFEQMIMREQNTVKENRKDVAKHETIGRKPSKKEQIKDIVSLLIKYQAVQNYSTTDKCNAALYGRRKKHFIFGSINTSTVLSFR